MVENERYGDELQSRTRAFAVRVMRLVHALPDGRLADVIGRQVLRSATSVGANYRAARRARSTADFIAKLKIVEEEADETVYWLELLAESGLLPASKLEALLIEGNAIVAIIVASIRTTRGLHEDTEGYWQTPGHDSEFVVRSS